MHKKVFNILKEIVSVGIKQRLVEKCWMQLKTKGLMLKNLCLPEKGRDGTYVQQLMQLATVVGEISKHVKKKKKLITVFKSEYDILKILSEYPICYQNSWR